MKNNDIQRLITGVEICGKLTGSKFSYALIKSLKTLTADKDALLKARKHPEGWEKYEEEVTELIKKYAITENGNIKFNNNEPVCGENQDKYRKASKKIEEKYKDLLEADKPLLKDWEKMMEEESAVELFKCKPEDVPEAITVAQRFMISELIDD
jgi:hypothetical protein